MTHVIASSDSMAEAMSKVRFLAKEIIRVLHDLDLKSLKIEKRGGQWELDFMGHCWVQRDSGKEV